MFPNCSKNSSLKKLDFLRFLGVLEGLESSGKPVGKKSTYPGTYKSPWCRVMTKNPGGNFLFRSRAKSELAKLYRWESHRKKGAKHVG